MPAPVDQRPPAVADSTGFVAAGPEHLVGELREEPEHLGVARRSVTPAVGVPLEPEGDLLRVGVRHQEAVRSGLVAGHHIGHPGQRGVDQVASADRRSDGRERVRDAQRAVRNVVPPRGLPAPLLPGLAEGGRLRRAQVRSDRRLGQLGVAQPQRRPGRCRRCRTSARRRRPSARRRTPRERPPARASPPPARSRPHHVAAVAVQTLGCLVQGERHPGGAEVQRRIAGGVASCPSSAASHRVPRSASSPQRRVAKMRVSLEQRQNDASGAVIQRRVWFGRARLPAPPHAVAVGHGGGVNPLKRGEREFLAGRRLHDSQRTHARPRAAGTGAREWLPRLTSCRLSNRLQSA